MSQPAALGGCRDGKWEEMKAEKRGAVQPLYSAQRCNANGAALPREKKLASRPSAGIYDRMRCKTGFTPFLQ